MLISHGVMVCGAVCKIFFVELSGGAVDHRGRARRQWCWEHGGVKSIKVGQGMGYSSVWNGMANGGDLNSGEQKKLQDCASYHDTM